MPERLETLRLPAPSGGQPRELPVITLATRTNGPTAVITANVHGDEVTGLGAAHQLLRRLRRELKRGRVHVYPSMNPDGLVSRSRAVPPDNVDLNRLFPGEARGNPTERLAWALWSDIARREPRVLIDLHADAPTAIPYTLLDRATGHRGGTRKRLERQLRDLGAATGVTALWEYPDAHYLSYRLDRSLSGAALNRLGVPALTVEAGPRLIFDPPAVETAVCAAMGVLTALGLVDAPAPPHPTRLAGGPWRREAGPRASLAGVLYPLVKPGQRVTRNDPVAEICDLAGRRLETLRSHLDDAWVVALPERAWVGAGVASGTFAVPDTEAA